MPLDALCLAHLVGETADRVVGGKIDKIHQTARYEVVLSLRSPAGNCRLLLSARPGSARLHLTERKRENPAEPPMFCMLLRKHLTGSIASLEQVPGERIVRMEIEGVGDLGDRRRRTLVLEAMGQQANLILLDEDGRILDALRRVEGDITTGKRQVLPGLFYSLPVSQEKPYAGDIEPAALRELLATAPQETKLAEILSQRLSGLSPLLCRELAHRLGNVDLRLFETDGAQVTATYFQMLSGAAQPTLLTLNGERKDFSFLPIAQYGELGENESFADFGAMLDAFYGSREQQDLMRQKGESLRKLVDAAAGRLVRKLASQMLELNRAEEREQKRIYGDLITSNLHLLSKGDVLLHCENYFDGGTAEIKLDPLKTPQQNAARYYKDYARLKTAEQMLGQQMAQGELDLEYLRSVQDNLARAQSERDLAEIRQELSQNGYLKAPKGGKKQQKVPAQKPLEYRTSAGLQVLVGRNNLQNDQLSFKIARHTDLWLHVQKAAGSHVILECDGGMPDDKSIEEAARLAVQHSSLHGGAKVAVDYTTVRNLKKPPGAKPGMVIYHKYWTLYL